MSQSNSARKSRATEKTRPPAPRRSKERTRTVRRPAGTPADAEIVAVVARVAGDGGLPEVKRGDLFVLWMDAATTDGEVVGLECARGVAVGRRVLTLKRGVKLRTQHGVELFKYSQIKRTGRVMHVERDKRIVLDFTTPEGREAEAREAEAPRVNPNAARIAELRERLTELRDITDESERFRTLREIDELERAAEVDPSDEWRGFNVVLEAGEVAGEGDAETNLSNAANCAHLINLLATGRSDSLIESAEELINHTSKPGLRALFASLLPHALRAAERGEGDATARKAYAALQDILRRSRAGASLEEIERELTGEGGAGGE